MPNCSLELPTQEELCCTVLPRSNWVKFDLFLILSSMLDIALKQVATVSEVLHLDGIGRSFSSGPGFVELVELVPFNHVNAATMTQMTKDADFAGQELGPDIVVIVISIACGVRCKTEVSMLHNSAFKSICLPCNP